MAQDFKSIISGLDSIKPKIEKLAKNNELITVIDDLNDIIDDATGFGGAMAQIVPTSLKAQVEALTSIYNQLKQISKSASTTIEQVQDRVESIPVGQLMKKPLKSVADNERDEAPTGGYSLGGISASQRESLAFDDDKEEFNENLNALKESRSALSDFYKDNFKENKQMKSAYGFSFDNIKEDFSSRANQLGNIFKETNKSYAPAEQMGDIFARLSEAAEIDADDIINDNAMQLDESTGEITKTGEAFNWKKMAESAGASLMKGILEADSISNGGHMDISDAGDPFAGFAKGDR